MCIQMDFEKLFKVSGSFLGAMRLEICHCCYCQVPGGCFEASAVSEGQHCRLAERLRSFAFDFSEGNLKFADMMS